jgi:hypothetical protein
MLMDTSFSPFRQVLRKLCMFKPSLSQEPLLAHCCWRHYLGTTSHSYCHISYLPPLIEVFMSILEFAHHKLRITHGLTIVTASLCGWEAFPTLGPSRHWWHKSPVSIRVLPGAHGVLGTLHEEVHAIKRTHICNLSPQHWKLGSMRRSVV